MSTWRDLKHILGLPLNIPSLFSNINHPVHFPLDVYCLCEMIAQDVERMDGNCELIESFTSVEGDPHPS